MADDDAGGNDNLLEKLRKGPEGPPGTPLPQDMTERIYQLLREMGLITAQGHRDQAVGGMQEWLQQSRGSTANIVPQLLPQLRQLREQMATAFSTVSRRLGPMGGAQIGREQSATVGKGGEELSNMLAGMQQKGVMGLQNFLQNLRPAGVTQLPQLTSSTQDGPPMDFAAMGTLIAQMAGVGGQLWKSPSDAPTMASLNPGWTSPPPGNLSGINSGFGDFVTFGA